MIPPRARAHRDAVHQFIDWVTKIVPCDFAPIFARPVDGGAPARMHFVVPEQGVFTAEQVRRMDLLIDLAASDGKFAAVLWPHIRTTRELVDALLVLLTSDRWRFQRVAWGDAHARPNDVLVGLKWRNAEGEWSSVMGFAPHGSMPVPRRAPYHALVWWPGGRQNIHNRKPQPELGFIDADHRIEDEVTFKAIRERSTERTKNALAYAPEDFRRFREVAFCLPDEDVLPALHRLERRGLAARDLPWLLRRKLRR